MSTKDTPTATIDRIFDLLAEGLPLSDPELDIAQGIAQAALDTGRLMGSRGVVLKSWAAQQLTALELVESYRSFGSNPPARG